MNIVVPTFHREGSLDKYNNSNIINALGGPDNFTIATVVDKDSELMNLLKNCDETSRPICFETIDVILRNKDADKIVKQLTGMPVNEAFRQKKIRQLDDYLSSLESLAKHWNLINESKYQHRSKNHGIYNRDMVMFPHRKPNAPFLSS